MFLAPGSALPEPGPTNPPAPVHGEVLMLTSELIVVKAADGTSILIPIGKDTPMDSSVKAGDRVEVVVTSDHHVTSIKKLAPSSP